MTDVEKMILENQVVSMAAEAQIVVLLDRSLHGGGRSLHEKLIERCRVTNKALSEARTASDTYDSRDIKELGRVRKST